MNGVGVDLCQALGLDPDMVLSLTVELLPGCWPVVTARMLDAGDRVGAAVADLASALRTFDVVERVTPPVRR